MASRKEYEALFRLNAQLGGGFSSTFKSAQSELSAFQNKMQSLNRTQSDIAAYQKQQAAVENTKKKLETLQQQYDNIQREIDETGRFSSDLENKLLSKQQQIDKTSHSLEQQTDKLHQMDSALKEANVNTGDLKAESAKLETQMADLRREQSKAAEGAEDFGKSSANAFSEIQQAIAAAGIAVALKEIYDGYMACVASAGDFEESMSTVEALSGASAEELAALSAEAKELGATTKFTAKESADAMTYMAMAGWDASDMLSGMDGVLQLAAASGEDLAQVSDIVTDNLSAFGLKASDTAHFSDVLAAAATNANTNVSIMGETFKMSASVAGALGYSVEDVAVAVGLMANSGVKGSIAGTALKNTFNGLLEGVTLTGASFGEYEYSAVRADGTMKDFGSTIEELRGYFDQMTEAERVNNAMTIAGERGYNGLLAILNATDEDYASLTASINNCSGAAAKMAAIKMDNMNGQLTLAKSAWDALKMSIGEQFTPVMSDFYEIEAKVFGGLSEFVDQHPALVKAITAFITVVGAATAALTAYAAIKKVVNALNVVSMFSVAGPIMLAVGAVAALTAGIASLVNAANEGVPSLEELTEAAREMEETMDEAKATYDDTVASTMAAAGVADTYIDKLEALEAAGLESNDAQSEYQNTLALLLQVMPSLSDCISQTTDQYGRTIYTLNTTTDALRANTDAWRENAMQQAYQDQLTAMYASYSDVLIEAQKNSIGLTNATNAKTEAEEKLSNALERIDELYADAQAQADAYYQETGYQTDATAYLSQEYHDLSMAVWDYRDEIDTAEKSVINYNKALEEDADAVAAAEAEIALAEEAVKNLTGATEEGTGADADAAAQKEELLGTIDSVTERIAALTEEYTAAYDTALQSINGQIGLFDTMSVEVELSVDKMIEALESQVEYMATYSENLRTAAEMGLSEGLIAQLSDGSTESAAYLQAIVDDGGEKIAELNAAFAEVEQGKEDFAGAIADMKTDFTATMDELQEELAADIEAMDLGDDAAESGMATIQGFIDGAESMLPQVQATYAGIASAAKSALYPGGTSGSGIPGYAVGTQSAAPGFALVGENGPELVYFNGGERVMTAAETAAMRDSLSIQAVAFAPQFMEAMSAMHGVDRQSAQVLSAADSKAPVSIQITFDIDGNVTPETVESLCAYGDDFADRVLEVLESAGIDAVRRSYT